VCFACVVTDAIRTTDLVAGDVVVFAAGDVRTLRWSRLTDSGQFTCTWSDGRVSLVNQDRGWIRLHPQPTLPKLAPPIVLTDPDTLAEDGSE
jgi:hypothetical protein